MSQKDLMKVKKCIYYISKTFEAGVSTDIAREILDNYFGDVQIIHCNNGFEKVPPDLWEYFYVVIIGVSPSDLGMRTIRSCVHDRNILWIDNQEKNIPIWTDYTMVPGERNPYNSLAEMTWNFFHK